MDQNTGFNESTGEFNDTESRIMQRVEIPFYFRIISVIEIPVMILTVVALCALIKSQHSAPVFVINLIVSDLIQISCMLMMTIDWLNEVYEKGTILAVAHLYSLMVGLFFMACVASERYLLVSHPIWYKSHHSLKVSCVISVIVWFVPLIFMFSVLFTRLPTLIGCFIPYLIVILCFVGTCRGLSHAISLTSLKRKLILGRLFLVLLTYTFLILPFVIVHFVDEFFPKLMFSSFFNVFLFFYHLLFLNPIADCLLYLFMRPDVGDLMKSVCCCVSVQNPASRSQTACSSV